MSLRARCDVLVVSLGSTAGLRRSDEELLGGLRRGGARAELVAAAPQRQVRTFALTDLVWARAAASAARGGIARHDPRALIYSTGTAALFWPRPGAIRLDAAASANRPGRHGLWQRPLERRRLRRAPLLIPAAAAALDEAGLSGARHVEVPIPVWADGSPPGAGAPRDVAALAYAADPRKKGLDAILSAWSAARRPGEELWVAGCDPDAVGRHEGVRAAGRLEPGPYRALLRRARVFVSAARREDYGLAQLEALADGCLLVTTESPGPYVALAFARSLDPRLVGPDVATAMRTALDDPLPGYTQRARELLAPYSRGAVDQVIANELLPALLS